jgi:class 3 adenylate cyclase
MDRGRLIAEPRKLRNMPLYMDVHPGLGDATPEDIAEAHRQDLGVQDEFGVRFLSYWFSDPDGKAFCLAEAPDAGSLAACHKKAHGLMPYEVIEVQAPTLAQFMGRTETDEHHRVTVDDHPDTALRAIMFTDIVGSTAVSTSRGDDIAVELVKRHDHIVMEALRECGGRVVNHTGDGVLASFTSAVRALEASADVHRKAAEDQSGGPELAIKIGITVGEPVEDNKDLFGAAVNLAARICAHARGGQTLVSGTLRDLAIGKGIDFRSVGVIALKGFPEAVPLFEVADAGSDGVGAESGGG